MSMFDRSRIKEDFSNAAARYDKHAALQQKILKNLLGKAKRLLPQNASVLDAGCGTGQLATLLSDCKVTAVDLAFPMCQRAALKGNCSVNAFMEALPFAENRFDMVFSSLALQWIERWQQAISEMERVLKPGGILAVSTFGAGTLHELKESFSAIDSHPHVSEFISAAAFNHEETVTEYFSDLGALMRQLKDIGARNKLNKRSRAVMTRAQFQRIEAYYKKHFATENGLPVTWKVLYSVKIKQEL